MVMKYQQPLHFFPLHMQQVATGQSSPLPSIFPLAAQYIFYSRISLRFLPKRSYWPPCPPYMDCYPTAPHLLCGWSDDLEWSSGCSVSDARGLLCCISLWP